MTPPTEQAEFEELRLERDHHASKGRGVDRERQRREYADERSFRLRGFKGKGFLNLRGKEREAAMEAAAHRNRVRQGTDGLSRKMANFMREEGLLGSRPRPAPWKRATKGASSSRPTDTKKELTPESVSAFVAKFKRTGDLPSVSVEAINGVKLDHIDQRALRRMIQQMLIRSGVEQNPGPGSDFLDDECIHAGSVVRGERLVRQRRSGVYCRSCSCKLYIVRGSVGYHPLSNERHSNFHFDREAYRRAIDSGMSSESPSASSVAPSSDSESSEAVPIVGPTPIHAPPQHREAVECAPPSCPPAPSPPVEDNPPSAPPTPGPGITQRAAKIAESLASLKGFTFKERDHAAVVEAIVYPNRTRFLPRILVDLIGFHKVKESDIVVDKVCVQYDKEKRLLINRNVTECKASFDAVSVTHTVPAKGALELALQYVAPAASAALAVALPISRVSRKVAVIAGIFSAAASILATRLIQGPNVEQKTIVAYVPHLVSAVVAEYDRGTNASSVATTIRQKFRRLAAFPLPDSDALQLLVGSETMAKHLLSTEDFFSEGAACCRRPL